MTNEEAAALLKQTQISLARGNGKVLLAEALQMAIQALSVDSVEVVRCEDCEYFDLDHFENFRGIPLIVAHEICNRWGNGCKTDMHGFCFMGEKKENGTD